ncbi:hypothetical protein [Ferroacidibacillus organovorans]|uniref:Uncharacterized protein n=1 Tax=Ferroacidibacillus organovorans TaxID=1765683 RepID=A0A117SYL7_9BACL|nr:hypothetical protein [Ferroacidibacillus organovorans]KUO97160.1 hypothetical protein ATW55_12695 [Ferroacidibacillus organovorans]
MWGIVDRVYNPRRNIHRGLGMMPTLLLGAGVGIAAWEFAKRRATPEMTTTKSVMRASNVDEDLF